MRDGGTRIGFDCRGGPHGSCCSLHGMYGITTDCCDFDGAKCETVVLIPRVAYQSGEHATFAARGLQPTPFVYLVPLNRANDRRVE